jgi:hypothetical protein
MIGALVEERQNLPKRQQQHGGAQSQHAAEWALCRQQQQLEQHHAASCAASRAMKHLGGDRSRGDSSGGGSCAHGCSPKRGAATGANKTAAEGPATPGQGAKRRRKVGGGRM